MQNSEIKKSMKPLKKSTLIIFLISINLLSSIISISSQYKMFQLNLNVIITAILFFLLSLFSTLLVCSIRYLQVKNWDCFQRVLLTANKFVSIIFILIGIINFFN